MRPSEIVSVLELLVPAREPILLVGPPGVGKTDLVKQTAQSLECELEIFHPVVDEPIDYKGLPFVTDGSADFLPFGNLRKLLDATTSTIAFLDDLGQASPAVQAAAMQLLLAREINGQKISDHIVFIAATNRKQDKAGVSGILEPVKSRFSTILNVEVNVEDWLKWAGAHNMPGELMGFIDWRGGEVLMNFEPTAEITNSANPRTVANLGRTLRLKPSPRMEFELYSGCVGEGFATEFQAFLETYRNLPDPHLALENPNAVEMPTDPATCYAFSNSIAEYVTEKTMENFGILCSRMKKEYNTLTMQRAVVRNTDLQSTPQYIDWITENSNAIPV